MLTRVDEYNTVYSYDLYTVDKRKPNLSIQIEYRYSTALIAVSWVTAQDFPLLGEKMIVYG